jgi:hypothetical protein
MKALIRKLTILFVGILLFTQCDSGTETENPFFKLVVTNTTPWDLKIGITTDIQNEPFDIIGIAPALMTTTMDYEMAYNQGYFLQALDEIFLERGSLFFFLDDKDKGTYEWVITP